MNKSEFLYKLEQGLIGLPKDDIYERIGFYGELIDDMVEDGLSEEEAVFKIGTAEEIISQIISETPLTKIVKERITSKRKIKVWEIILLVLGSPIWLSLLIALVAVIFSLYVSLWAVIISLWSVFASFVGTAFGSFVGGVAFILSGNTVTAIAVIGAGIFLAGLSIFMFYGCKMATKGFLLLTKKMVIGVKNRLIKKEEA